MPVLPGAQNFVVSNSQFVDNSTSGPSGIDILLEASAPDATYDSGARAYAPRCFPGTREQYIEDIVQWAIPTAHSSPLPLFWMSGAAGVGKSAIAQTSAEKIKGSGPGLLGASFFFSINGRNNPNTFFPSIAYQLSVEFDDYREVVDRKILRDKTLVNKAIASQFWSLIVDPLVELGRRGKGIGKRIAIVVDGLDECEGVEAQCEIVRIVAASAREGAIPLCWAFFSRPEPHIEATFSHHDVADMCYQTTLPVSSDADGDIELYLRSSFSNVLRSRSISTTPLWPSDHDLKVIVKAANGLFIYATTVYRFIAQPGWLSLDEPLRAVLGVISEVDKKKTLSGAAPPSPFAELDAFYLLILRRVPDRILPSVRLLLRCLCLHTYQGAMALANLLRLSKAEIQTLCAQLSAVLKFHGEPSGSPEAYSDHEKWDLDPFSHYFAYTKATAAVSVSRTIVTDQLGGRIEFYHKSFNDFLVDPVRSGDFCVESSGDYGLLFENFRKLRLDYEDSYSLQNSELVFAPGIHDSGSSLSYACENEFINRLIKIAVYREAVFHWRSLADRPEMGLAWRQKLATADFRKELYIEALLLPKSTVVPSPVHSHGGLLKYVGGTRLASVSLRLGKDESDEYSLRGLSATLKKASRSIYVSDRQLIANTLKAIENEREAGMIEPYSPRHKFPSIFRSFHRKRQDNIESGLYIIGRDSKAIFWFWEINYDKEYYREFRTANLEEGKKIYRAEKFDLWVEEPRSPNDSR